MYKREPISIPIYYTIPGRDISSFSSGYEGGIRADGNSLKFKRREVYRRDGRVIPAPGIVYFTGAKGESSAGQRARA